MSKKRQKYKKTVKKPQNMSKNDKRNSKNGRILVKKPSKLSKNGQKCKKTDKNVKKPKKM